MILFAINNPKPVPEKDFEANFENSLGKSSESIPTWWTTLNPNLFTTNTGTFIKFVMFLVKTAILLCKLLCKIYPTWKKRQYKTIVCHVIASDYTKDIRISQDIWFILPEISDQPITSNRSSLSSNLQVFCEQ